MSAAHHNSLTLCRFMRIPTLLLVAALIWPTVASAAPPQMTREDIVKLGKTVVGFSYWWGGSKWQPGASAKGKCTPNAGSSGCPKCSHSGNWGADCSGFVGKAWQVAVAKPLDVAYHPYATTHFTNNTTWWTKIARSATKLADAFTYNTNGSGHIFLYDKGDPWGNVWAWECKGCKYGCTYSLRPASSNYGVRQRKLLIAPPPACTAKCSGDVMIDAKCNKGDCSKFGAKCVKDGLGLRCVSVFCPTTGKASVCLPDGKLGTCNNGNLSASACAGGKTCVKAAAAAASCVPPCPASCDDGNPCTKGKCIVGTGKCSHAPISGGCDDGDACTVGDVCAGGACKSGATKACEDGNGCTDDACANGACSHVANGAACDDGDACTVADTCAAKTCKGKKRECDDGLACTQNMCREGACAYPEIAAKPTAACQGPEVVLLSPCGNVVENRGPCQAGASCVQGLCVATGPSHDPKADPAAGDAAGPHGSDGLSPTDGGAGGTQLVSYGVAAPSSGCATGGAGQPAAPWLLVGLTLALLGWRRRRRPC